MKSRSNERGLIDEVFRSWRKPKSVRTGLEMECPAANDALLSANIREVSKLVGEWWRHYLFCYVNREWALFLAGAYSVWILEEYPLAGKRIDFRDPIVRDFFWFASGKRWPIEQFKEGMDREETRQAKILADHLEHYCCLLDYDDASNNDLLRFPEAVASWIS